MKKLKEVKNALRIFTGGLIMLHGLWKIIHLAEYIDFVEHNFTRFFIGGEVLLSTGATVVPFVELIVGVLLSLNICYKKTIIAGIFLSFSMSVFLIAGGIYPKLIYHGLVLVLLSTLYTYTTPSGVSRLMRQ